MQAIARHGRNMILPLPLHAHATPRWLMTFPTINHCFGHFLGVRKLPGRKYKDRFVFIFIHKRFLYLRPEWYEYCFINDYSSDREAGVPGGLLGGPRTHSRSTWWVRIFSRIKTDWRKARERELATFDDNRRAVGMLTPMRDKKEGTYRGREGMTPTCDHDLSRRSLRVKPPTS